MWLLWGTSEAPLYIKEGIISGPMLLGTFSGRMQIFGAKSQKLNKIPGFQNFVKLRFSITLANENRHNSIVFDDTGLIFYMQT